MRLMLVVVILLRLPAARRSEKFVKRGFVARWFSALYAYVPGSTNESHVLLFCHVVSQPRVYCSFETFDLPICLQMVFGGLYRF